MNRALGMWLAGAVTLALAPADQEPRRRLQALIEAINARDSAVIIRFGREHYQPVALAETGGYPRLVNRWLEIGETIGPVRLDTVVATDPSSITAWARGTVSGSWLSLRIVLDSVAPQGIVRIGLGRGLRPPHALTRVPAVEPGALPATIRRYLDELAAADLFSGVVLITGRQGDLVAESYGLADRAGARPFTMDTPFDIASVGKTFTAVAIGRLVDAGSLSLSDSVGRLLPDLPAPLHRITVGQLLEHSSGLGELGPGLDSVMRHARSVRAMVSHLRDTVLAFAPGADFQYSNRGYLLLGAIVEQATGLSYRDVLARNVLGPAGMTRTTLDRPGDRDRAHRYTRYPTLRSPYTPGARVEFDPADDLATGPHGGAYSTARDLARFGTALMDGRLLRRGTTESLTTPRPGHPWGRGFQLAGDGVLRRFGHAGGAPGANTVLWVLPDPGYTVVVLSNYDTGANVAAAYITDLLETALSRF